MKLCMFYNLRQALYGEVKTSPVVLFVFFDKNTFGDVIAIRNDSGEIVAIYDYDAWGNIIYKYGAMADVNPFRYRGYYYDTETGFYYLQTRYYDPTICRFINALMRCVEESGVLFKEKKEDLTKTQKTLFENAEDRYNALYGELKFY